MLLFYYADLTFLAEIDYFTWTFLIISAFLDIVNQSLKFNAYRNAEIPTLMKYSFLMNIWQFLVDKLIIHKFFTPIEYLGFLILGIFYIVRLIYGIIIENNEEATPEEEFKAIQ